MNPEVLLPASATVQAYGFGLATGALLLGVLCWFWGHSSGWGDGFTKGYSRGWKEGVANQVRVQRVASGEDVLDAGMRRHRGAVVEWERQGRR